MEQQTKLVSSQRGLPFKNGSPIILKQFAECLSLNEINILRLGFDMSVSKDLILLDSLEGHRDITWKSTIFTSIIVPSHIAI